MATTAIQKSHNWTYDDYITLPDDLNIYEVIDGEFKPSLFSDNIKLILNLLTPLNILSILTIVNIHPM